jgi:hypothetical protein
MHEGISAPISSITPISTRSTASSGEQAVISIIFLIIRVTLVLVQSQNMLAKHMLGSSSSSSSRNAATNTSTRSNTASTSNSNAGLTKPSTSTSVTSLGSRQSSFPDLTMSSDVSTTESLGDYYKKGSVNGEKEKQVLLVLEPTPVETSERSYSLSSPPSARTTLALALTNNNTNNNTGVTTAELTNSVTELHRNHTSTDGGEAAMPSSTNANANANANTNSNTKSTPASSASAPARRGSRRNLLQRAVSVPSMQLSSQLSSPPSSAARLSSFMDQHQHLNSKLRTLSHDAEDSTIDHSWRANPSMRSSSVGALDDSTSIDHTLSTAASPSGFPPPPPAAAAAAAGGRMVRSLSNGDPPSTLLSSPGTILSPAGSTIILNSPNTPSIQSNHLTEFLDSLIDDANSYQRKSPGANFRKRLDHSHNTTGTRTSHKKPSRHASTPTGGNTHKSTSSSSSSKKRQTQQRARTQSFDTSQQQPQQQQQQPEMDSSMPSLLPVSPPPAPSGRSHSSTKPRRNSNSSEGVSIGGSAGVAIKPTGASATRRNSNNSNSQNNVHNSQNKGHNNRRHRTKSTTSSSKQPSKQLSSSSSASRSKPSSHRSLEAQQQSRSQSQEVPKETAPPKQKSAPIGWSRPRTSPPGRTHSLLGTSSNHNPEHDDELLDSHRHEVPPPSPPHHRTANSPSGGKSISSMSSGGMLSAFLDREGSIHNRRPVTSAHTVSGDPRVRDTVSIAINEKTFQVGPREAKMIQTLLEAAQHDDEAVAVQAATNNTGSNDVQEADDIITSPMKSPTFFSPQVLQTPSNHSTIAESDRISTRSSLMVELSPPLVTGGGKVNNLSKFLDHKHQQQRGGRTRGSGAFTVAGDRVSHRFQGKSTSEMLEQLKEEQQEQRLEHIHDTVLQFPPATTAGTTTKNKQGALRPTKSGARHPRSDLDRMALTPDLGVMNHVMHESMAFLGAGAGHGSMPSLFGGSQPSLPVAGGAKASPTRAELQSFLDGRSPNARRKLGGSNSVSGDLLRRSRSKDRKKRNSATASSSQQAQQQVTEDFREFRPPSAGRPTNRRSLLRKMQSVPILSTVEDEPSMPSSSPIVHSSSMQPSRTSSLVEIRSRRRSRSKDRKSISRSSKGKNNQKRSSSQSSRRSSSRRSGKKALNSSLREDNQEKNELELEELEKSFLDQFLDGDEELHDSASQMKDANDDYKAKLVTAHDPLHLSPETTQPSQRALLPQPVLAKDPLKSPDHGRTDYKRVKNAGDEPSSGLMQLYDPSPAGNQKAKSKVATADSSTDSKATPVAVKKAVGFQTGKEQKAAGVASPKAELGTTTPTSKKTTKRPASKKSSSNTTSTPKNKGKKKTSTKFLKKKSSKEKLDTSDRRSSDEDGGLEQTPDQNEKVKKNPSKEKLDTSDRRSSDEDGGLEQTPGQSERVTLQSLPRQGVATGDNHCDVPDTSGHVRLVQRIKMLSNRNLQVEDSPIASSPATATQLLESAKKNSTKSLKITDSPSDQPSEFSGWTKAGVPRPPLGTANTEISSPPPKPMRKLSRGPGLAPDEAANTKQSKATPPPPVSPRPGRLPPVAIAEGSILEVDDDTSVCSELTDNFSWEPMENEYSKSARRELGLVPINEMENSEHGQQTIGDTSWGGLSFSARDKEDQSTKDSTGSSDKRRHLSKRWQSTPNIGANPADDMLKSPTRVVREESEEVTFTKTPGRRSLGWIKKKIGLKKKVPATSK